MFLSPEYKYSDKYKECMVAQTQKPLIMTSFLKNGILGKENGFLIPLTTEEPSLLVTLDDFSEEFRINIHCGQHYIDSITLNNYRQICNSVLSLPVYSRFNEYLGNVMSLIEEQLFYAYLKIHKTA